MGEWRGAGAVKVSEVIVVTVGGALSSLAVALASWWYIVVRAHGHAHPLSASCLSVVVMVCCYQ